MEHFFTLTYEASAYDEWLLQAVLEVGFNVPVRAGVKASIEFALQNSFSSLTELNNYSEECFTRPKTEEFMFNTFGAGARVIPPF